jgi:ParB-like chromosome segregation protein Spo0J
MAFLFTVAEKGYAAVYPATYTIGVRSRANLIEDIADDSRYRASQLKTTDEVDARLKTDFAYQYSIPIAQNIQRLESIAVEVILFEKGDWTQAGVAFVVGQTTEEVQETLLEIVNVDELILLERRQEILHALTPIGADTPRVGGVDPPPPTGLVLP